MTEKTFPAVVWAAVVALMIFFVSKANAQVSPGANSRSFQYVTGVLTSTNRSVSPTAGMWNMEAPPKYYTLAVTTTASSSYVVRLEGSLDNSSWANILITNTVIGMASNPLPIPALYLRLRATTVAAGASVTATAIGVW